MPKFYHTGGEGARQKGGDPMNADEKKIVQTIAAAVSVLPAEKREYILGYAEGVIACSGKPDAERLQDSA